jgi:Na+-driven multidrug efflux pump
MDQEETLPLIENDAPENTLFEEIVILLKYAWPVCFAYFLQMSLGIVSV